MTDSSARIGPYRVRAVLGRGGMGDVYLAEDERTSATVALKVLPRELSFRPDRIERFQREARTVASLDHPAIVRVLDSGSSDGVHYIAMEPVEGASLAEIVRRAAVRGSRPFVELISAEPPAPIPAERASEAKAAFFRDVARTLEPIASVVHLAHQHGIVHRDIKPSNVLVDRDGNPHLTDFGIARIDDGKALTSPGEMLGTADYMSPEQVAPSDDGVALATDVFSLGATLFECLTGRPPFGSGAPEVVIQRIRETQPPNPRAIDSAIPEPLARIALRCLEKAPDRRYATSAELADDLARFVAGQPVRAKSVPSATRAWRHVRERGEPLAAIGGAIALVIVCAIVVGWTRQSDTETRRRRGDRLRQSGVALYGLGRIDDAREQFDRAIDSDPDNPINYVFRALTAIAERRESDSKKNLAEAVARGLDSKIVGAIQIGADPFEGVEPTGRPDTEKALIEFLCGLGCERRLDYRSAHDRFEKSLRFDPDLIGVYREDATVLDLLGEPRIALEAIERYCDHVPQESEEWHIGRGLSFHLKGEWTRAVQEYDLVSESDLTPEVAFQRGQSRTQMCMRRLGAPEEALKAVRDYRMACSFDPANAKFQVALANALMVQSALLEDPTPLPEAEALVSGIIQRFPDDAIALGVRGVIALGTDEFESAVRDLERASNSLPMDTSIQYCLALAHRQWALALADKQDEVACRRELLHAERASEKLLDTLPLADDSLLARNAHFAALIVDIVRRLHYDGMHDDAFRLLELAHRYVPTQDVCQELATCVFNRFSDGGNASHEDRDRAAGLFAEAWDRGDRSLSVLSALLYLYSEHRASGATVGRMNALLEAALNVSADKNTDPNCVVNLAIGLCKSGEPHAATEALRLLRQAHLDDPDKAPAELRDGIREVIEAAKKGR
ncbi:MAG: protein kinase [Planctomycetes bacterium]|nr:protein kinase [Planctomycetota bacterium]MBI3845371.1 protein kinase [Planctomycetota bacterium]